MKEAVERAIAEIRDGLPSCTVRIKEDPDGGAYVVVEGLDIGEAFDPPASWVGFHVAWSYPDADVYPHFLDPVIRYVGSGAAPNQHPGGNLPTAMTRDAKMPGFDLAAVQVSRRSNRRDAMTDSALQKLFRILEFLRSR